mmetsp:Transcript_2711/g.6518  ORF Transcript_2711/g.6518 Transcript_2711/m.6518 type:complete len:322 (+) Transcript_2711:819-1784(+)
MNRRPAGVHLHVHLAPACSCVCLVRCRACWSSVATDHDRLMRMWNTRSTDHDRLTRMWSMRLSKLLGLGSDGSLCRSNGRLRTVQFSNNFLLLVSNLAPAGLLGGGVPAQLHLALLQLETLVKQLELLAGEVSLLVSQFKLLLLKHTRCFRPLDAKLFLGIEGGGGERGPLLVLELLCLLESSGGPLLRLLRRLLLLSNFVLVRQYLLLRGLLLVQTHRPALQRLKSLVLTLLQQALLLGNLGLGVAELVQLCCLGLERSKRLRLGSVKGGLLCGEFLVAGGCSSRGRSLRRLELQRLVLQRRGLRVQRRGDCLLLRRRLR